MLITRMELNRAYNAAHHEGLLQTEKIVGEDDEDPLLKRADAYLDARAHPLSMALHGMTVAINEPWRVPIAAVQKYAALAKKRATGILWPKSGAYYVGMSYPAHYGERGRQTAWRASWGKST